MTDIIELTSNNHRTTVCDDAILVGIVKEAGHEAIMYLQTLRPETRHGKWHLAESVENGGFWYMPKGHEAEAFKTQGFFIAQSKAKAMEIIEEIRNHHRK